MQALRVDTAANRTAILEVVQDADLLFIEAHFAQANAALSDWTRPCFISSVCARTLFSATADPHCLWSALQLLGEAL
jgi:hypothetical protein